MEYIIKFIEIEISYIIIKITPPISDLQNSLIKCFLNCKSYEDFTFEKVDMEGSFYRIVPIKALKIYDEISMHLNGVNIYSNYIKAHLCKEYRENKGLFVSEIPNVESGRYDMGIESLNDTNFERISKNQIICNGINEEESSIQTEQKLYHIKENINFNINIIDKDGKKAPDGNYFVYIKIEEIS